MGMFAGGALRLFSTFVYFLEFCCAGIGLAIYSYFLAKLSFHHLHIANDWRAVEGLTGAGVLYTIFAVIFTCFLGGSPVFAILGIVLNIAFCGAFVAVAVLTREAAHSCSGIVHTPLGTGFARDEGPAGTHLSLACKLNTAVFATAIVAALLFAISVFLQFLMMRHHQKEKKYGPSPANNYTSGSAGRFGFFKRKPKTTQDAYGDSTYPPANRVSHETGYTGTTMTQSDAYANGTNAKYEPYATPAQAAPYHTQPTGTGTAVNY